MSSGWQPDFGRLGNILLGLAALVLALAWLTLLQIIAPFPWLSLPWL